MSDEKGRNFQVIAAQWPADEEKLYAVRHQVFVVEQHVPEDQEWVCLLYTSPSPRDGLLSRMPSSA